MGTENSDQIPQLTAPEQYEVDKKIEEIVNSYLRIAGERDHINEIKKDLQETYGVPKKATKQIADLRYHRNADEVRRKTEELIEFEETLRVARENNE